MFNTTKNKLQKRFLNENKKWVIIPVEIGYDINSIP